MNLLVTDFDKTLYDDNYQNNIKKVNLFASKGNMFVIATGRSLEQLLDIIKDDEIDYSYLICNDGSIIYDRNLKVIKIYPIINANLFLDDFYKLKSMDLKQTTTINNNVISAKGKIIDFKNIKKEFFDLISKYPNIRGYISDTWCQITSNKTNKAYAIKELDKIYNFDNIYTIGDHDNDIDMISEFTGFRMKNSKENLKKMNIKEYDSVENLVIDLIR